MEVPIMWANPSADAHFCTHCPLIPLSGLCLTLGEPAGCAAAGWVEAASPAAAPVAAFHLSPSLRMLPFFRILPKGPRFVTENGGVVVISVER